MASDDADATDHVPGLMLRALFVIAALLVVLLVQGLLGRGGAAATVAGNRR